MSQVEIWINAIANLTVCLLCLITTSILISTWYSIDNEGYPRWTLIAIGLLYLDFAIKRMIMVFSLGFDMWSTIVWWDIISIGFTTVGMIGHIAKAKWVRSRIVQYRQDVAVERAKLEDMKIEDIKKETQIKMLETKLILLNDSKISQTNLGTA